MSDFEKMIVGSIPLAEASSFFLKLKYGSAGPRVDAEQVLRDFVNLAPDEQQEIMKEAGIKTLDPQTQKALADLQDSDKTASAKVAKAKKLAYAEHMLPGTEHYYSDRMRSVLESMPAKVWTPEGVDYTT